MITFSSLLLKGFFDENKSFFISSKVQKIQQPSRRELILHLRNQKETRKFYVNINPNCFHLCFAVDESLTKRQIAMPQAPPMFCMLLRKYIENSRIIRVNVPQYERILELYFEYYDEIGEKNELCLAIELMGKYSNVVLYNAENNIILGCMHNVGEDKSQVRELSGGLPYIYPPKKNKKNLLKISKQEFEVMKPINQNMFYYVSGQILEDSNSDYEKLSDAISDTKIYNNGNEYSFFAKEGFEQKDFNTVIDNYYSKNQENSIFSNLKSNLLTSVHKKIKKQQKLIDKYNENITDDYNKFKLYGDMIFANLYKINNGDTSISVQDYQTGEEIVIPLDKNFSASQNAQKYYKKYAKDKKAREYSLKIIEDAKELLKYLEEAELAIEISDNIDELKEIKDSIISSAKNKKQLKTINIEKVVINGFDIYIGKNKYQNDYMLSKIASPEDIWVHLKDMPSAHIIIKKREKEIDELTIFEASKIVKKLSKAKNSSKVSVIYTKKKFVKKIPKSQYGFVNYREEKEILLD